MDNSITDMALTVKPYKESRKMRMREMETAIIKSFLGLRLLLLLKMPKIQSFINDFTQNKHTRSKNQWIKIT